MVKYLATVRALEWRFEGFTLQYIPRAENTEADELVKAAATTCPYQMEPFTKCYKHQQRR